MLALVRFNVLEIIRRRIEGLRTEAFDSVLAKRASGNSIRVDRNMVSPKGARLSLGNKPTEKRSQEHLQEHDEVPHDDVVRKIRIPKEIDVDFFDSISAKSPRVLIRTRAH